MSVIYTASTFTLTQQLYQSTQALSAATALYHLYHVGLIATAFVPVCLLIAGIFYWRWRKQHNLIALLDESAKVDHKTQMKNREGMNEVLLKELSRAQRYKTDTSVLMIDIDHLSNINELYGKKVGDRTIIHIGKTIVSNLRMCDTVGHVGAEKFMAVLPETAENEAAQVAERIRKTILEKPLIDDAEPIIASVSIGVASYNNEIDTPFKLINHSDQALYHAKHSGRNQVHCWAVH